MSKFTKAKAQMKSNMYYVFWGACTFAVMAGQIFVGAGYQSMSNSVKDLTEMIEINMEWEEQKELLRRGIDKLPLPPQSEIDPWKSMPIIR